MIDDVQLSTLSIHIPSVKGEEFADVIDVFHPETCVLTVDLDMSEGLLCYGFAPITPKFCVRTWKLERPWETGRLALKMP